MKQFSIFGNPAEAQKKLKKAKKDPLIDILVQTPKRHYPVKPPIDAAHQNQLADEYLNWALNDPYLLSPIQFPIEKLMAPSRFFKIAEYNDYFKDVVELVRTIMIERLKKIWYDHPEKSTFMRSILSVYWPEYRATIEKKSDEPIKMIIETDPIPDSPLVPPLLKEPDDSQ